MVNQNNNNNSRYIFKNLLDAIAYLLISVIYPVYSFFLQYDDYSENSNEFAFFGLIVGGIFFYATYTYDFIQKYSDAEIKTKIIFKFLLFGSIFYFVLTVFSIFILIHTLVHRELINMLFNISKWIFIISSIPCYYPTVEIFDRIKQRYLGKISKATV